MATWRREPKHKPKLIVTPTDFSRYHAEIAHRGRTLVIIDGDDADWFATFLGSLLIREDRKSGQLIVASYSFIYYAEVIDGPAVHYHFQSKESWHRLIDNYISKDVPRNISVHPKLCD